MVTLAALLYAMAGFAGENWKLKKTTPTMKIYTGSVENSDFKSVKVETVLKGNLSQVVAVLFDISNHPQWVFNTKSTKLLKRVSDNEIIYYSEMNVPWPAENRDLVAHLHAEQKGPGVVAIESHGEPVYVPEKDGIVRVKSSKAHWTLTAVGDDKVKIDYVVSFDPSGSVPAWLTNMFVTKGPAETFEKLQSRISLPAYKNVRFAFIKE